MQRSRKLSTQVSVVSSDAKAAANAGQPTQPPSNRPVQLKPTDQTIPPSLKEKFPDKVEMYEQLQNRERALDMLINKKLLDLQEHQQKLSTDELSVDSQLETLRIYIYNTSANQSWQEGTADFTPDAPPLWTLRIEGRLLDDKTPLDDPNRLKMSWFLSGLTIDLKSADDDVSNPLVIKGVNAPGSSGSADSIIEWHDDIKLPEADRRTKQFDGMDVKRGGSSVPGSSAGEDREIVANIVIQPKMYPIRLQITDPALMELVGAKEIIQTECIKRIFWYAKVNQLFEVQNADGSTSTEGESDKGKKVVTIKSDELLMKIFGLPSMTLPQIMEIVGNRLLKPVDPIRVSYNINTLKNTTLGEFVIDLKVNRAMLNEKKKSLGELEDINKLITEDILNKQSIADLIKLDESLKLNIQLLNYSKMKYDFYKKFSENPSEFLKLVLQKNEEYLKILSSDSMSFGKDGLVSEELVRKSDFYSDEFLRQHINLLLNSGRI